MNLTIYFSKLKFYYFFVLFAFLFPRGFSEHSEFYKLMDAFILWCSVLLILVKEAKKILNKSKINNISIFFIVAYFVFAIIDTIIVRRDLTSGLQQLFAVPVFCIFFVLNINTHARQILDTTISVFILFLSLNLIITPIVFKTNLFITPSIVNNEFLLIFLGHVQLVSQYCLAAILASFLYYITYQDKKTKIKYLIIIALFTMLTTDADSAVYSAFIIIFSFIAYKFRFNWFISLQCNKYVIALFLLNLAVIYLTAVNKNLIPSLDFSGRQFVWKSAIDTIVDHPIFGYGVDGVLLYTFWTEWLGRGFNYAHNQILQNMLDGGILLTILFWGMLSSFISKIDKVKSKSYRIIGNTSVIILLFLMIFDSTTLYMYMYITLILIYKIPKLYSESTSC